MKKTEKKKKKKKDLQSSESLILTSEGIYLYTGREGVTISEVGLPYPYIILSFVEDVPVFHTGSQLKQDY